MQFRFNVAGISSSRTAGELYATSSLNVTTRVRRVFDAGQSAGVQRGVRVVLLKRSWTSQLSTKGLFET